MCLADAYVRRGFFSVAVLSITVFKSINRCPLKFSGHYRGINELEKVGFSGRLQQKSLKSGLSILSFPVMESSTTVITLIYRRGLAHYLKFYGRLLHSSKLTELYWDKQRSLLRWQVAGESCDKKNK